MYCAWWNNFNKGDKIRRNFEREYIAGNPKRWIETKDAFRCRKCRERGNTWFYAEGLTKPIITDSKYSRFEGIRDAKSVKTACITLKYRKGDPNFENFERENETFDSKLATLLKLMSSSVIDHPPKRSKNRVKKQERLLQDQF